jgi:hypothetical protein
MTLKLPALRNADAHTRLSIYLNDHLGGSAGGVELARRLAQSNKNNEYGLPLADIAGQIEEDVASLRDVMTRLGIEEDKVKQVGGWAMEKVGRLKLNGQLFGYSPLSRLLELEGLLLGVTGKQALWQVMQLNFGQDARLADVNLGALFVRARDQRRTLDKLRNQAASEALR